MRTGGQRKAAEIENRAEASLVEARTTTEEAELQAAGIRALVAVSAPTTLAVRLAREAPMMLAGFARYGRCTVYSRPDYLDLESRT